MPKYTVVVTKSAQKQLDKLSDHIANPILSAISDITITLNNDKEANFLITLAKKFLSGSITIPAQIHRVLSA